MRRAFEFARPCKRARRRPDRDPRDRPVTWRSSWSASAGRISRPGRAPSTSPPGCAWRRTTKSPAARCCHHARDAPAAGPRRCCGWRRWPSGAPRRRWGHSTAVCRRVSARPRRAGVCCRIKLQSCGRSPSQLVVTSYVRLGRSSTKWTC